MGVERAFTRGEALLGRGRGEGGGHCWWKAPEKPGEVPCAVLLGKVPLSVPLGSLSTGEAWGTHSSTEQTPRPRAGQRSAHGPGWRRCPSPVGRCPEAPEEGSCPPPRGDKSLSRTRVPHLRSAVASSFGSAEGGGGGPLLAHPVASFPPQQPPEPLHAFSAWAVLLWVRLERLLRCGKLHTSPRLFFPAGRKNQRPTWCRKTTTAFRVSGGDGHL